MNSRWDVRRKAVPYFLFFGRSPHGLTDFSEATEKLVSDEESIRKVLEKISIMSSKVRPAFANSMQKVLQKEKEARQRRVGEPEVIKRGDVIFLKVQQRENKMAARFEGPYEITEELGEDRFALKDLKTNKLFHRRVKMDQMKKTSVQWKEKVLKQDQVQTTTKETEDERSRRLMEAAKEGQTSTRGRRLAHKNRKEREDEWLQQGQKKGKNKK